MTKEEIRKIYLNKRIGLSAAEYSQLNRKVSEVFFSQLDLSQIKILHTFLPINKTKEMDTWLIINRIRKEFPSIKISIPRINNQTAIIDNFYLEGPEQLEKNTWGIPEPKQGIPTPTEKIDAILVPLLAFDRQGNRVGYGRGFYDKFLATSRQDAKKIGLSFFEPVKLISNMSPTDIKLTHAVTTERLYTF